MKKRRIKSWVWLLIGFIGGLSCSNLFIYSDLIKMLKMDEKIFLTQIIMREENESLEAKETDLTEKYTCTLDEVSCLIKKYADKYEIDYKLAIAISKHETGNYTSNAFKNKNNVGGMMSSSGLISYNSLDEGIDAFVKNLANNYIKKGLDTIEKIQPKYAPIGATNDPDNLNNYWIAGVTKYYNKLETER